TVSVTGSSARTPLANTFSAATTSTNATSTARERLEGGISVVPGVGPFSVVLARGYTTLADQDLGGRENEYHQRREQRRAARSRCLRDRAARGRGKRAPSTRARPATRRAGCRAATVPRRCRKAPGGGRRRRTVPSYRALVNATGGPRRTAAASAILRLRARKARLQRAAAGAGAAATSLSRSASSATAEAYRRLRL